MNPLIQQHRLINTYVDNYKHKLSLREKLDPLEQLQNKDTSLTIDFNELQRLVLASANPGFDPIAEYVERKRYAR
jgi:hypothetical protein